MTYRQNIAKGGTPSNNIGTSLIESVCTAGAADVAADVADVALDAVLDEGILKDIPIFGWLVKGYGVVNTIRDRLFLKKMAMFLYGVGQIGENDRNQFREKLMADEIFCRKVGENLVLLLDRQDNFDKAYILGKTFSGYICNKIDYVTLLKLAMTIDRAFIDDLKNLDTYYTNIKSYDMKLGRPFREFLDDTTSQSLYNAGLVRSEGYTAVTYYPNELGSCLLSLLSD